MKIFIVLIVSVVVLSSVLSAEPPEHAGFATGSESALYLYWFHPQLHVYRQMLYDEMPNQPIIAGVEGGDYYSLQRINLPAFSLYHSFDVTVYNYDYYPDLEGDQNTPFIYTLFQSGDDSLPTGLPIVFDTNSLVVSILAESNQIENEVSINCLIGGTYWAGISWLHDTPAAPQFFGKIQTDLYDHVVFGIRQGNDFSWKNSPYVPRLTHHFMALMDVDEAVDVGHRTALQFGDYPNQFKTVVYHASDSTTVYIGNDTLICNLPDVDIDSARIYSCYFGESENMPVSVAWKNEKALTIQADIDFTQYRKTDNIYEYSLKIENLDFQPVNLRLGYDSRWIECQSRNLEIAGFQTSEVNLKVTEFKTENFTLPIFIQDKTNQHYPYFVFIDFPPQDLSAEDDAFDDLVLPEEYLVIYPNPAKNTDIIHFKTKRVNTGIKIYNITGQLVKCVKTGSHNSAIWNACDESGNTVAPGVYFALSIRNSSSNFIRKIVILK